MEENKSVDLSSFAEKPKDTKEIIQQFKDNILNGVVNPLEGFTVLKRMNKVVEELIKDPKIKELAEKEFDKYGSEAKGSLQVYGASISKTATYTTYDCKGCNHSELNAIYEIQEVLKNRAKQIEDELRLLVPKDDYKGSTIPGFGIQDTGKDILINQIPELVWNDGGGEVCKVQPPRKIQTIGLKYIKL